MNNALKLRVMFDMIDNWTKPLRNVLNSNKGLAQSLKQTRGELAELGKQQKAVATFREMRAGLADTSAKLKTAQAHVKGLAGSLRAFGPPSQSMIDDLSRARAAASKLRAEEKKQTAAIDALRGRLNGAGIDTRNLSQHERQLRSEIAKTTAAMTRQSDQLDRIAEREKKVAKARGKMHAMQGVAANMAVSGYAARAGGMHALDNMRGSLDEAKKMTNERARVTALGLGDGATKDAEKYVRAMRMMGVSTTDNMTMMRDALSIFADEHHAQMVMPTLAKMKFANEALFGAEDAHENEEKFMNMLKVIELRGGTKDEATFKKEADMVQKVLSATGGRVGGDEWRHFIQTGGVAAKQMRRDAFFYQMEPLIQEMGGHAVGTGLMSAYSNAYQGKTTKRAANQMIKLGLLDKSKVIDTKIGTIKEIKPGALTGGQLFKASPLEWLEKVMLPKLAAKGITDPDKIKDMISTIFTNRTAANLFTTMYMQRTQIHKNERLNAGAHGIDSAASLGAAQTQGKEIDALAKLRDLKLQIGEQVAPLYNAALDKTREILSAILGVMSRHQAASKVIVATLAAVAALLVVLGTFTIALAGVLGPLAVVRFSMQMLGMQGGVLTTVLRVAAGAFRFVGTSIMFIGRALLMNPIGLAITAIAVAAFLIYEYWGPIKQFVLGLWDDVRAAFHGGLGGILRLIINFSPLGWFYRAFAGVLSWFGIELPTKFTEFGGHLIGGLIHGITSRLGAVKNAIVGVANSTVAWFKEKLGIHSPSRVFAQLGGFVGEGAALGMAGSRSHVARAALGLATAAVTGFGSPAPATAALVRATVPIDRRPPLVASSVHSASHAAAPGGAAGPITINIYGNDPHAIAREVNAILDRRDRAQRVRAGSRLSD